ncbi:hypothetical protein B2G71_02370 [Novosphingobium sp. PC22D]|uniref:hypothetical protein n=1 Tax=Novosphingobium sp. PC22D TaxID=1962403 RepID=UPI000BF085AA|nr:hypothetical protein [Novosphingobium sp. PC22D]PEQ14458.1 hypothetical protein B2G71_02370 [Novosphingobium sp. PC22D]
MIARSGTGWQVMLADLSLILFMVTAAVLAKRPEVPPPVPTRPQADLHASEQAEPLAVWIAAPDAPGLDEWLAAQPADARQQLTVTAFYTPGGQARALAEAARIVAAAGPGAEAARIVIEPGAGPPRAAIAFDVPPGLARGLRDELAKTAASPPAPTKDRP